VAVAIVLLLYRLVPAMPTVLAGGASRIRRKRQTNLPLVLRRHDRSSVAIPLPPPPPQRPDLEPPVEVAPVPERSVEVEPASERGLEAEPAPEPLVELEPAPERGLEDESAWATAETSPPSKPEDLRLEGWVARVCLLSVLPLAATVRVVLGHGLLPVGSGPVWAVLGAGLVLAAAGSWWLWVATSPPYPLSPLRGGPLGSLRLAAPAVAALAPFWLGVLPAALLIMLT
jgi:hypothetical protein